MMVELESLQFTVNDGAEKRHNTYSTIYTNIIGIVYISKHMYVFYNYFLNVP